MNSEYNEIKTLLLNIYKNKDANSGAAYSNPVKIYREAKLKSKGKPYIQKITLALVKKFLTSVPTYSLDKPLKTDINEILL